MVPSTKWNFRQWLEAIASRCTLKSLMWVLFWGQKDLCTLVWPHKDVHYEQQKHNFIKYFIFSPLMGWPSIWPLFHNNIVIVLLLLLLLLNVFISYKWLRLSTTWSFYIISAWFQLFSDTTDQLIIELFCDTRVLSVFPALFAVVTIYFLSKT